MMDVILGAGGWVLAAYFYVRLAELQKARDPTRPNSRDRLPQEVRQ